MVLPVSAADQINYFDTAYLVPVSGSGASYQIKGQSVVVSSNNSGEAVYAYFIFRDVRLQSLAGETLVFSYTATASGVNKGQINIRFMQDGQQIAIVYNATGSSKTVEVPESFDELQFVMYSSSGGSVSAGDTVTYSNIKLMGPGIDTVFGFTHQIGLFFSGAFIWLGDVLDVITGNFALIVLCLAMPVIGFSVGLLSRIKS